MPANIQLYNRLLQTPLFQGMSTSDMKLIVGHTKFDFTRFEAGKTIAKDGDRCTGILFLLQGTIEVTSVSSDHTYYVTETISAPYELQPERIFGLHQYYFYTLKAHTDCNFMILSKEEITKLLDGFLVFRINYLNILSSRLQKAQENIWYSKSMTLYERIQLFFIRHCIRPAGWKHIYIKMNRLAEELGTSRLNVSIELNKMKALGLLTISRGHITIPALEHLISTQAPKMEG